MAADAAIFLYKSPVYLQRYTGLYVEYEAMIKLTQN